MAQFQYFELAAFFLSLALLPRLRNSSFAWFIPYLAIVVMVDILANYIPVVREGNNQWRFNLYLPVQNLFFSYLFYQHLNRPKHKRLIFFGVFLFGAGYLVNIFFIQGLWTFNNNAFIITGLQMIVYSNLYFLEMIGSDSNLSAFKDPMFWISSSCLIFFTVFSVFFAVYFYYSNSKQAFEEHRFLYLFIDKYVNTVHYSLLMMALLTFSRRRYV